MTVWCTTANTGAHNNITMYRIIHFKNLSACSYTIHHVHDKDHRINTYTKNGTPSILAYTTNRNLVLWQRHWQQSTMLLGFSCRQQIEYKFLPLAQVLIWAYFTILSQQTFQTFSFVLVFYVTHLTNVTYWKFETYFFNIET